QCTALSSGYDILGRSNTAYQEDPIRRIGHESASTVVEIDLT
ncbi:hypothetical protein Tco_0030278, partial [Tanacetum coccineum]